MINVVFKLSKDGRTLKLDVLGHAGMAPKGHDIVCAAASMLTYTLAAAVSDAYADRKLSDVPKVFTEGGEAHISCRPYMDYFDEMGRAYKMVQTGFQMLACNYPECIRLTIVDKV